jgi:hypothetical protein
LPSQQPAVRTRISDVLDKNGAMKTTLMKTNSMKAKWLSLTALLVLAASTQAIHHATAEPARPFVKNLFNTHPLMFGMNAEEAQAALGVPLVYIRGKPGNEIFGAARPSAGNFSAHAKLFLQFRNGRLTGWKGDWERNWMWQ